MVWVSVPLCASLLIYNDFLVYKSRQLNTDEKVFYAFRSISTGKKFVLVQFDQMGVLLIKPNKTDEKSFFSSFASFLTPKIRPINQTQFPAIWIGGYFKKTAFRFFKVGFTPSYSEQQIIKPGRLKQYSPLFANHLAYPLPWHPTKCKCHYFLNTKSSRSSFLGQSVKSGIFVNVSKSTIFCIPFLSHFMSPQKKLVIIYTHVKIVQIKLRKMVKFKLFVWVTSRKNLYLCLSSNNNGLLSSFKAAWICGERKKKLDEV